jgi:hypothetical protein
MKRLAFATPATKILQRYPMAGDHYFIEDLHGVPCLTFNIVEWIDVFTRKAYKQIIVGSLNYHIKEKGVVRCM